MQEILRDPLWTFVGAIFAIIAVVVMILIFFAQRKGKKLSYEITSNSQLLGVKDEVQGKVQILYEGKEVRNVHLLTIKFINNGGHSISSSDYEYPLSISIDPISRILTHEIVNEDPKNLGINLRKEENKIIINPVLLNIKDSFCIKMLVSDFQGRPEIEGRISGVKNITQYVEGEATFVTLSLISMLMIAIGALNLSNSDVVLIFGNVISKNSLAWLSLVLGYVMILVGTFTNRVSRRIFSQITRAAFIR